MTSNLLMNVQSQRERHQVSHGRPVSISSTNYLIRNLKASDTADPLLEWLNNHELLRGMNLQPSLWNLERLRRFIANFNNITNYFLGIFDRDNGKMIGFYTLDVNIEHRSSHITAAIGDPDYVGKKVLYETSPVLVRELFENHNIEKISARILASNRRVLFNFLIPDVFQFEARLKQEVIDADGKRADMLVFSSFKHSDSNSLPL